MSQLPFKTSGNIGAAKYEGVKMIAPAPRNPEDYHSLQDIIRYRLIMQLKELYGNARVNTTGLIGGKSGIDPFVLVGDKISVNGIYYLDGYRMELENIISEEDYAGEAEVLKYLILEINFDTINFTEDTSIAIQDPGTNKFIPTSERFIFDYKLRISANSTGSDLTFTAGSYTYLLGTAEGVDPEFTEHASISLVETTFAEAIEIVESAIHTDLAGWANIEKLRTTNTGAKAYIEKLDNDFIKFGLEDASGVDIGVFEMVYDQGRWQPILWMKAGGNNYPRTYITSDNINFWDNKGNSATLAARSLDLGSNKINFNVNEEFFGVKQLSPSPTPGFSQHAIKATQEAYTISNKLCGVSENEANEPATPSSTGFEKASWLRSGLTTQSSVYSFHVPQIDYPNNGHFSIKHHFVFPNRKEGFIHIRAFASHDESAWQFIQSYAYPTLYKGQDVEYFQTTIGLEFPAGWANFGAHFRLEYSLECEEESSVKVEYYTAANGGNISWRQYITPFSLVEVQYLRMNKCILWIDNDNLLRIKAIAPPYDHNAIGNAVEAMVGNIIGYEEDDPGGMAVGGGGTFTTGVDDTIAEPTFTIGENGEHILLFPSAKNAQTGSAGLMPTDELRSIWTEMSKIAHDEYLSNVVYVSPSFANSPSAKRFQTIAAAANYIYTDNGQDYTKTLRSATIVVYPGTYTENITIGNGINIVCQDPGKTLLKGKLSIVGDYPTMTNCSVNIPIEQSTNDYGLYVTANNINLTVDAPINSIHTTTGGIIPAVLIDPSRADYWANVTFKKDITTVNDHAIKSDGEHTHITCMNNTISTSDAADSSIYVADIYPATIQLTLQNCIIKGASTYTVDAAVEASDLLMKPFNVWATHAFNSANVSNILSASTTSFNVNALI